MGFREDCAEWSNEFGVMLNKSKIIDGNALLYTGAKFSLMKDLGIHSHQEYATYVHMLQDVERAPGLIDRYAKPGDKQQHDDYIGLLAASAIEDGGEFARRVYDHGRANWYSWNNQDGKWALWSFFVRQPGFWATVKAAAGKWLNPFDSLMASVDLLFSALFHDGHSGLLMNYLQYKTYVRKCCPFLHPGLRLSCWIFKKLYLRKYPKGIKESYSSYFSSEYALAKLPDGFF